MTLQFVTNNYKVQSVKTQSNIMVHAVLQNVTIQSNLIMVQAVLQKITNVVQPHSRQSKGLSIYNVSLNLVILDPPPPPSPPVSQN